ncbi:hypothetical protein JWR97_20015, partial [Pseudomonas cedrina subsp. fulgida]|nr:hypothetical protein [Pseudomonas cedrina subsp. fulgida]
GALLKFTVRNGILFRQNDQVLLRHRSLTPRAYIRRIAAAGDLRILVPSDNWPGRRRGGRAVAAGALAGRAAGQRKPLGAGACPRAPR